MMHPNESNLLFDQRNLFNGSLEVNLFYEIIGYAIVFQLFLVNHSCVPNTNKTFDDFTMILRATNAIALGENITLNLISLEQNKFNRQKQMRLKHLPECKCVKCRLKLDKDLDYDEFNDLYISFHLKHWLALERPGMGFVIDLDYRIDWQLIIYMKSIFGANHPIVARTLAMSFVYFAECSRFASKSSLRLWYKEIEPLVRITHGSDHPYYVNFKKFASNYINL